MVHIILSCWYDIVLTFAVPIIPEFLYTIRHQYDHLSTARPSVEVTTNITILPEEPITTMPTGKTEFKTTSSSTVLIPIH